ncbi:MAG: hypothetical protein U9O41_00760 [Candidatus Aerophobetes bacterium]|nr:hypothetical protein [Candidatus Aerophobetes bacterium]
MAKQLHLSACVHAQAGKRFSVEEVKALFQKYLHEGIELVYILKTLKIKKSRFFKLLSKSIRETLIIFPSSIKEKAQPEE